MEEPTPPPVRPPASAALGSPAPGAPSAAGGPGGTSSASGAAAALSFSTVTTAAAAALGNRSGGSWGAGAGGSGGGGRGSAGEAGSPPPLGPEEEAAPPPWHGAAAAAAAAQALVLLLIFLLSSLGNCAVMGVIAKHRQLRTVTNAFVVSLSLSDLLAALLCLPAAFLDLLAPPAGDGAPPWRGLCAASRFFGSCFGIASALSVALIALDRYCAIVRPPRDKLGRRRALQLLAGAWLAALGFSLPWELLLPPPRRELPAAQGFHGCLYRPFPDPARVGAAYSAGLVLACYLLPFLLMCFCHCHIRRAVRPSGVRVRPLGTHARAPRPSREARTATTVLIMIVLVICCRGPYCFAVLLAAARRAQAARAPSLLNVAAVWLAWANGAINPVVYAMRNPNISALLGRRREEGYRTRSKDALLAHRRGGPGRAKKKSRHRLRNRCVNRLAACGRMASSNPTSWAGGDVAMWARKNPVVLFCREGPPELVTPVAKQSKSEAGDTSF